MSGPVQENDVNSPFKVGNCRRAIQLYFHLNHGLFLKPNDVLLPEAYENVGIFVESKNPLSFKQALSGDIVYAERVRNKNGNLVYKERSSYKNANEWILHFHTVIYLGKPNKNWRNNLSPEYNLSDIDHDLPIIWHASAVGGGTCFWDMRKFLNYYRPVAIKRLLTE